MELVMVTALVTCQALILSTGDTIVITLEVGEYCIYHGSRQIALKL
jgi:hypothetical protein